MTATESNIRFLKKIQIFNSLSSSDLEIVYNNCDSAVFKQGTQIRNESDLSNTLYIIQSGNVLAYRQEDGHERIVAEYEAGEAFGEIDIILPQKLRASIKAENDVNLLLFPKADRSFSSFMEEHPSVGAQIVYNQLALLASRIRNVNNLVAEKTEWVQDLRDQLLVDKLTGLYNKTYLTEEFAVELPKYGEHTSVVMVKPDRFKTINDTFGHEAGDNTLLRLADNFKRIITGKGTGVRYRGNEFAVILPNCDYGSSLEMARYIKTEMSKIDLSDITQGQPFALTMSVGIATYPEHANQAHDLVELSFTNMFKAVEQGGDVIIVPACEAGNV